MADTLLSISLSFENLADRIEHPRLAPAVEQVRGKLAKDTDQNFERSRDPDGNDWKPPVRKLDRKLLVKTGLLRQTSVTQVANAPVNDSGFTADPAWEPFYGIFHQEGTSRLAARPFAGFGEQALDDATGTIADQSVNDMERAFA
jgi:phage virion morphogenesis protein